MTQLINPKRYGLFTLMYESESPEGEMIIEYAEKEANRQPHTGETPPQIAAEIIAHGKKAVAAIEQAAPYVKNNRREFERLQNDMYCYNLMANYYAAKARAAVQVLKYKYSKNVKDLEQALPLLQTSVNYFKELAARTDTTYLYANSMQTQQRKIPVVGRDAKNKTWSELLQYYERELKNFARHIDTLKAHPAGNGNSGMQPLKKATVQWMTDSLETFTIQKNAAVFSDTAQLINDVPSILQGLQGIRFNRHKQINSGTSVTFRTTVPVKILVGFFVEKNNMYLPEPQLETDASANEYGQAEVKIANAIDIAGMPAVNVHAWSFQPGTHTLTLGKGLSVLLGVIPESDNLPVMDAGFKSAESAGTLDWLFE
jgi:hypothetical protein